MKTIILAFALLFSPIFGLDGYRCGTLGFAENSKKKAKGFLAKNGCIPENYYGKVLERRTQNFIIFYTEEKLHAIKTPLYIDSLALYLENALKMFKDSLGLKYILGATKTLHYQKNVPAGLYPVEVADTGLLRGSEGDFATVYGLTFSVNELRPERTQIVIENDFLYGANCSGTPSSQPFKSYYATNTDYSVNWHLALKATVFHELYHSFQATYFDINRYRTFWLEASAAGAEEIGAPEINDYLDNIYSLSRTYRNPIMSMEESSNDYAYSTLYLFLFSKLGPKFDSHIWNSFSKNPREKFALHLAGLAKSINEDNDPEDLFHEYARRMFFSGNRASVAKANPFWPDQHEWPAWRIRSKNTALPVLPVTSLDFVRQTDDVPPNTDSAKISLLEYRDSAVWVLSRLLEMEYIPPLPVTKRELAAYPNPWNPGIIQSITFRLPEKSKGVEIRSSNGILLERIKSEDSTVAWQPKKLLPPGILYYRVLPYGKNKPLIVEW